jgi:hypothetical protein
VWTVRYHPAAIDEELALPVADRVAMENVIRKLRAAGPGLGFPHQSAVRGTNLRELRPRAGRSRWRALYRRVGNQFVVAAIGPEAMVNKRGFDRAVATALDRLSEIEETP